jgi:hypothetical protein
VRERGQQVPHPRRGDRQRPARRPDRHAQVKLALASGQPLPRCRLQQLDLSTAVRRPQMLNLPRTTMRGIHHLHRRRTGPGLHRAHIRRHQPTLRPPVSAQPHQPKQQNQQVNAPQDHSRQDHGPSQVAALDPRVEPRVYERDGFVVTLWTYYEPATFREVSPADYANVLGRLHAGMRKLDVPAPHFTDRVEQAQQLVASRDHTPALADADRELLGNTLGSLRRVIGERGGAEQLLHGEPHPGNVLTTKNGLLFIDLETCCRGPIEFDLAHAPEEVSEHYPGVNQALLRECRILVLAMITTWRWDRGDQLPNGRQLGTEWLSQIRAALDRNGLDAHG